MRALTDIPRLGRARTHSLLAALAITIAIAAVALGVWAATRPIPVTVDGQRRLVPRTSTVGDLVTAHTLSLRSGNLVAVVSKRVLRIGAGATGTVVVDSEPATQGTPLHPGAVVVSRQGSDVVEATSIARVTTAPRSHYVGHGAYVVMTDEGRAGVSVVTRGAISGEVVSSRVAVPAKTATSLRRRYSGSRKVIALTFDDGPHPTWTPKILAVLAHFKAKATFFEIGEQVTRDPDVARDVVRAGMEIGNHTQSHEDLAKLTSSRAAWQIDTDQSTIQRVTGFRPTWLRPPDGAMSRGVYVQANAAHVRIMLWDVDTEDWKRPAVATIVARALAGARPGAVILMHDGGGDRSNTLAALPTIITKLRAQGYSFDTLDEMFGR